MGNGAFARYNGGKITKLNATRSSLSKGFMVLQCLTCGFISTRHPDDGCLRCQWVEKVKK